MAVQISQFEWAGIVLGHGTPYVVRRVLGLGMPQLRTNDTDRARDHGGRYGLDLFGGRRIGLEISAADESLDEITEAMVANVGQEGWLTLWLRGWDAPRRINVRPRVLDPDLFGGTFDFDTPLEWYAADPRLYAQAETQVVLTLATSGAGFTFPLTFPLVFGGGSSGIETVTNVGNFETWPTVRIHGPVTSPRLEHVDRGQTLELNGTVPDGSFLDVDMHDRTVLRGGTASRYEWVKGDFWPLDRDDNQIRYSAASGSGTAELTFLSAWGG